MRFHIQTFGCQMNAHDSGWLARALTARGWREVPEDQARVFIVNTCSVREKPELKVYSLVGRLSRHLSRDPRSFCAVGGCVAQQVGAGLLERFPFVRLVFGTDQTDRAPQALERLMADPSLRLALTDVESAPRERAFLPPAPGRAAPTPGQAFVTIMQGCDNFCAYCIVPFVRGRQKSRPARAVIHECRTLAERGVREITLLGQNVNSYGLDKWGSGLGFADLLSAVAKLPGLDRLRFTTSHPKDLDDAVAAAFADCEVLAPHLHLPLQAGSDTVLHRMGRGYDMARYMDRVLALRRARPDLALTTDLIVGFPGETEEDFGRTMAAVEEVGFESSFSFVYSDRPGTRAQGMEDKVPREVKAERLARLQALQDELTARSYARAVGSEAVVLAEGASRRPGPGGRPSWRGHDAQGRVVNFTLDKPGGDRADLAGSLVRVRVSKAKKHSLWGEGTGEPW